MNASAWGPGLVIISGAALGAAFGLGLVLVIIHNPWTRERSVEARIGPYVRGSRLRQGPRWSGQHPVLERTLAPLLAPILAHALRLLGSREELEKRLALAGLGAAVSISGYRLQQVSWAVGGFLLSFAAGIAILTTRNAPVALVLAGVIVGTVLGVLGRDYYLTMQVNSRASRLAQEFPSIADLLALAIAAGEGPVSAMERVARTSRGALADELGTTVAEIRAGATVEEALVRLGERTPLDALGRFAETLAVALERGTPLADVVRAQAQDARDLSKRHLMESAGKREIAMLLPVVFFLMPLVIVFAIFPGLSVLRIGL